MYTLYNTLILKNVLNTYYMQSTECKVQPAEDIKTILITIKQDKF